MSGPVQAEVDQLNADFKDSPYHVWLSSPSPGRQPRVCASRAFPTNPHAVANPDLTRKFTGCGEMLDTGTADEMRDLLTARAQAPVGRVRRALRRFPLWMRKLLEERS